MAVEQAEGGFEVADQLVVYFDVLEVVFTQGGAALRVFEDDFKGEDLGLHVLASEDSD